MKLEARVCRKPDRNETIFRMMQINNAAAVQYSRCVACSLMALPNVVEQPEILLFREKLCSLTKPQQLNP